MRKIGMSCLPGFLKQYGIDRSLEIIKESGFDAVDFSLMQYGLRGKIYGGSEDEFCSHFDAIRKKAEDLELEISQTHGRTCMYEMKNDAYNADAIEVSKLDLKATAILGAPSCVIHFPSTSVTGMQSPAFMQEITSNIFDSLVPYAEEYKVNIAYETFGAANLDGSRTVQYFANPDAFMKQFDALDTKYKTICVDTGHTHEVESFWLPSPEEIIKNFGKNVTLLHLHDNSGKKDDHLLPGLGNINWPAVFDALDEIDYTGVCNFELIYNLGKYQEDFARFVGRYLRKFVDRRGNLKD